MRERPILVLSLLLFLFSVPSVEALAGGLVTGKVTYPDKTDLSEMRIVLVSGDDGETRRTVRLNKKGEFLFGMVPNGQYTIEIQGTALVPHSIHVVVFDAEHRQELLNYQGPPPRSPQPFVITSSTKVTYEIALGPSDKAPAAVAEAERAALEQVPALIQTGDYSGALENLGPAIARSPDDPLLRYYAGVANFKLDRLEKAETEIRRALELNPQQVGAHWVLGAILASRGSKLDAISEFEKEIANPQTDSAGRLNSYINIGLIQRELSNREAAIKAFERVIELDSGQAEAYSYLADLYLATGHPEKAEEVQARSQGLGLEDPNAVFNLGASYWNSKEYAKAEAHFRHAVELDPRFALAWKSLGYALVNQGKTDEAISALSKYLELEPDAADAEDIRQTIAALGNR